MQAAQVSPSKNCLSFLAPSCVFHPTWVYEGKLASVCNRPPCSQTEHYYGLFPWSINIRVLIRIRTAQRADGYNAFIFLLKAPLTLLKPENSRLKKQKKM